MKARLISRSRANTGRIGACVARIAIVLMVFCLVGCVGEQPVATPVPTFDPPVAVATPTDLPSYTARSYPTPRCLALFVAGAYPMPPTALPAATVAYPLPTLPKKVQPTATAMAAPGVTPTPLGGAITGTAAVSPTITVMGSTEVTATLAVAVTSEVTATVTVTENAVVTPTLALKPTMTVTPTEMVTPALASTVAPSVTATAVVTPTLLLPTLTAEDAPYPAPATVSSREASPAEELSPYPGPKPAAPPTADARPTPKPRGDEPDPTLAADSERRPSAVPDAVERPLPAGEPTSPSAYAPIVESGRSVLEAAPLCTTPMVADERLVAAINGFGFELFAEVVGEAPESSVLVAPLGTHVLLTMLYNGAMGDTRVEMREALGLESMSMRSLNEGYADLLLDMEAPGRGIEATALNALLFDERVQVDEAYLTRMARTYRTVSKSEDLSKPNLVADVNAWTEAQTHGLLTAVLEEAPNPEAPLVLANALHFRGAWRYGFNPDATLSRPFVGASGVPVDADMMSGVLRELGHVAVPEKLSIVRLPFTDERVSLWVLLPDADAGATLASLLAELDAETWAAWSGAMTPRYVEVELPRLSVDSIHALAEPLASMGMSLAFSAEDADLRAYAPEQQSALWIDDVYQRVVLDVGDEGVEQGRAPGASGARTIIPFVADHPFAFVVRDDVTGVVLLIGVYTGPE